MGMPFFKSLWLQLAWSTQERLGGNHYFNSYGLLKNSKQNPAAYDASLHPGGFSEFATTYPSTNDYPFDFAQSLLLLHKRQGGKCRFMVGEALLASGLIFVSGFAREKGAGGK